MWRQCQAGGSSGAEVWTGVSHRPAPGSDLPFRGWGEVLARIMRGKLDEGNGSQLLAELLQHHHALEEGLVVQLLPRSLARQLLAHQKQLAWELGYPLDSLHQVPDHPHQHGE